MCLPYCGVPDPEPEAELSALRKYNPFCGMYITCFLYSKDNYESRLNPP